MLLAGAVAVAVAVVLVDGPRSNEKKYIVIQVYQAANVITN